MKNVRAKKYLGQHFLNDYNISKKITDLLNKNSDFVIEIGPGMGILTNFLIKQNINLELIELDKECVSYLKLKYPEIKNNITEADFLKVNLQKKYAGSLSLIGNFPYNISSQILFKVIENKNSVTEVVGMFQKEVAKRIVSKKGKERGILSVLIQTFYDTEYCFTVNENLFTPPPKVKSAVIRLTRNKRQNLNCNTKLFKNIVKSAFNQRRKTLRNALKSFSLEGKLKDCQLEHKRAEELSVEDFIKITLACQKEMR